MGENGNGHEGRELRHAGQRREQDEDEDHAGKALRARLERLSGALAAQSREERRAAAEGQEQKEAGSTGALGGALSLAFRVLSEFVAAVIVGTAMGWGIDRLAGTSPIFLIVFVLLGAAAGFWNVYRLGTGRPDVEGK